MKHPTLESVADMAHVLMEASPRGETTTLEVKTALRHFNFHTVQADVSDAMEELEKAMGWSVEHVDEEGKQFKVFSMRCISPDVQTFQFR